MSNTPAHVEMALAYAADLHRIEPHDAMKKKLHDLLVKTGGVEPHSWWLDVFRNFEGDYGGRIFCVAIMNSALMDHDSERKEIVLSMLSGLAGNLLAAGKEPLDMIHGANHPEHNGWYSIDVLTN